MRRALFLTLWLAVATGAVAQEPALSFEVTSVKPYESLRDPSVVTGQTPGRFVATNAPIRFVLLYAYRLRDYQLIDAPAWLLSTRYNITGTYEPSGPPNDEEVRARVRTLLRDRFGLVVHRETRDVPAYALTLARADGRLGPQLVRSDVDCTGKRPALDGGGVSPVAPSGQRPSCGMISANRFITGGSRPISELARNLDSAAGRPVVDRTRLDGNFNIDVKWGGDEDVSLFTALQEQLGLKLESSTTRTEVIVVDRIDRPTEN